MRRMSLYFSTLGACPKYYSFLDLVPFITTSGSLKLLRFFCFFFSKFIDAKHQIRLRYKNPVRNFVPVLPSVTRFLHYPIGRQAHPRVVFRVPRQRSIFNVNGSASIEENAISHNIWCGINNINQSIIQCQVYSFCSLRRLLKILTLLKLINVIIIKRLRLKADIEVAQQLIMEKRSINIGTGAVAKKGMLQKKKKLSPNTK